MGAIRHGWAEDLQIHGKIPLLVTLEAVEAGTGHIIRVAKSYKERMAGYEGAKKHVYRDSKGILTVGEGFNMEDPTSERRFDQITGTTDPSHFANVRSGTEDITQDEMVALLAKEEPSYEAAVENAIGSSTYDDLTPERQAVLTEAQANMKGGGIRQFPQMIGAIQRGDFANASYDLVHGAHGGPSKLVNDVHEGRSNNYAASLRWDVLGAPAATDPAKKT